MYQLRVDKSSKKKWVSSSFHSFFLFFRGWLKKILFLVVAGYIYSPKHLCVIPDMIEKTQRRQTLVVCAFVYYIVFWLKGVHFLTLFCPPLLLITSQDAESRFSFSFLSYIYYYVCRVCVCAQLPAWPALSILSLVATNGILVLSFFFIPFRGSISTRDSGK
jgi:hypothetical protein